MAEYLKYSDSFVTMYVMLVGPVCDSQAWNHQCPYWNILKQLSRITLNGGVSISKRKKKNMRISTSVTLSDNTISYLESGLVCKPMTALVSYKIKYNTEMIEPHMLKLIREFITILHTHTHKERCVCFLFK